MLWCRLSNSLDTDWHWRMLASWRGADDTQANRRGIQGYEVGTLRGESRLMSENGVTKYVGVNYWTL